MREAMRHTIELLEALSLSEDTARNAARTAEFIRSALRSHIQHTGACHLCDGTGQVETGGHHEPVCCRSHDCACMGHTEFIPEYSECPYQCGPEPPPAWIEQNDFEWNL